MIPGAYFRNFTVFLSLAFIPAKNGFPTVFGMHQGLKGDLKYRAVTLHDIC